MSDASPSHGEEKEEKEETAAAPVLEVAAEEGAACSPSPLVPPQPQPQPPLDREPGLELPALPQSWLLDLLDDVRYLISCTNWY